MKLLSDHPFLGDWANSARNISIAQAVLGLVGLVTFGSDLAAGFTALFSALAAVVLLAAVTRRTDLALTVHLVGTAISFACSLVAIFRLGQATDGTGECGFVDVQVGDTTSPNGQYTRKYQCWFDPIGTMVYVSLVISILLFFVTWRATYVSFNARTEQSGRSRALNDAKSGQPSIRGNPVTKSALAAPENSLSNV
jgi:hypothetical protein